MTIKTTIRAQQIAFDYLSAAHSGVGLQNTDEMRSALAAGVVRFLSAGDDVDDREAAVRMALASVGSLNRKLGIDERTANVLKKANEILNWTAPKEQSKVAEMPRRGRGRPPKKK
ncbi:MAG: hypothetical protein ABUJ98_13185 [Hyphomicrobium sp.]